MCIAAAPTGLGCVHAGEPEAAPLLPRSLVVRGNSAPVSWGASPVTAERPAAPFLGVQGQWVPCTCVVTWPTFLWHFRDSG